MIGQSTSLPSHSFLNFSEHLLKPPMRIIAQQNNHPIFLNILNDVRFVSRIVATVAHHFPNRARFDFPTEAIVGNGVVGQCGGFERLDKAFFGNQICRVQRLIPLQ